MKRRLLFAAVLLLLAAAGSFGFAYWRAVMAVPATRPIWEGPLTLDQRQTILDQLGREVAQRYSYLGAKGIDWPARLDEYRPRALEATDDLAFYGVLEELVASLGDGHSALVSFPGKGPSAWPPLAVRPVEGSFVITHAGAGDWPLPAVITAVDGLQVEERVAKLLPSIGTATEGHRRVLLAGRLLEGAPGTVAWVTVRDAAGREQVFEAPRSLQWAMSPADSGITGTRIGEFGYIGVPRLWGQVTGPFDQALEELRETAGLVIDLRGNGGGDDRLAEHIAGRLLPARTPWTRMQFRIYPFWTPMLSRSVTPAGPWTYERPVVLLTDGAVFSSADFLAGGLARSGRAMVIGEPTGGGSGNPIHVPLPGGAVVRLSRWIEYFADGTMVEGNGTRPQILVRPTVQEVLDGEDPALERAVRFLRTGQ